MSGSAKQMMDLKPMKGMSVALSDEHQRRWDQKQWERQVGRNPNYDQSREHLNFEIRGGVVQPVDHTQTIPQRMKARLDQLGLKDPNAKKRVPTRRTLATIVFGGNRQRMRQLAFGSQNVDFTNKTDNSRVTRQPDIEKWALDVYRFVCDKWGEENVVGFYVHLDELNPHIHCSVLPIDKHGKLSFNGWYESDDSKDFRQTLVQWHNEFAEVNKKWGLARGDNVHETGARHKSTEEYRRELSAQNSELERKIADHELSLAELRKQIFMAEKRVKGLTTMLTNLEQKRTQILDEIERLEKQTGETEADRDRIKKEVEDKRKELSDVEAKIADKEEKLDTANRLLDAMREETSRAHVELADVRKQVEDATKDMSSQVKYRLMTAGFEEAVRSFTDMFSRMTSAHDAELFEDSLLLDMAERGNAIVVCASLLFMGYVDQAVQFAKGSGGGGSGSDLPWGRKEDEDDRAWARRCLLGAHKMTKPPMARSTKRK